MSIIIEQTDVTIIDLILTQDKNTFLCVPCEHVQKFQIQKLFFIGHTTYLILLV